MADNIGKVVVSFLGLAYLCGFLVVQAFFFRIGIHDLNMELLRLRYIQIGLLFLAFPFQHGDLLSEGEDFEGGIASTAKEDAYGNKDREDDFEHDLTLLARRNVASPG
jgi:hypothetical protein